MVAFNFLVWLITVNPLGNKIRIFSLNKEIKPLIVDAKLLTSMTCQPLKSCLGLTFMSDLIVARLA